MVLAYVRIVTKIFRDVRKRERRKRIRYGHRFLSRAQDGQFLGVKQGG